MSWLWGLGLQNTGITDISVLRNLKQLSYLDLADNQISDISAISADSKLIWLDISNNRIASLPDMTGFTQLGLDNRMRQYCSFSGNKITASEAAAKLPKQLLNDAQWLQRQGFTKEEKNISGCTITLGASSYTYNGKEKRPAVSVKDGKNVLKLGTDYTLLYQNNKNAGTAKIIITGKGGYKGNVIKKFTIKKASQSISYTKAYSRTYGDKAFTIRAKRTRGNGSLSFASSDKKVAEVNKNGKITIKGTGSCIITVTARSAVNYNAKSVKITVKISPKKQAISTLKTRRKEITLKWKKDTKASGYQIQYSTSKSFKKGVKYVTVNKNKTTSKTIRNLKKGNRYYVRVRSYKNAKVSGKNMKLYGSWSAVKRSGKIM